MGVPLPLPTPSPVVALPWSLVARRTITTCHQKCTGGGRGAVCPGLLCPCHTGSSTHSSWAEAARAQRPPALGTSHGKSPPPVSPQPVGLAAVEPLAIR